MKIAFFGGTFDPPHRGHLAIAQAAADRLHLDKVLFAPVGHQPLKDDCSVASFEDRMALVRLAVAPYPGFEASLADGPRSDNHPNYTIDTLNQLKKSLGPDDQLFCLIGADSFLGLHHWHRAADLLFACNFIVAGRPGSGLTEMERVLPAGVTVAGDVQLSPDLFRFDLSGREGQRCKLYLLPDLQEDISATEIRQSLTGDARLKEVLPEAVASYIREHNLYRG
ncbi:MAG TPA: nicotinate (nicotinamide) nucleotide adenylyltransferase [Pseudacidobacterium sp.]|jgi:nicotinate-nucleotide adenylyltransferase|nr:nicotinate (nicotinamide) nucleotide adenylyltransferase [Pseudacidobacterium sp.]